MVRGGDTGWAVDQPDLGGGLDLGEIFWLDFLDEAGVGGEGEKEEREKD